MKLNIRDRGARCAKVFVEVLRGVVEIRFDTPERRAEMEARVRW